MGLVFSLFFGFLLLLFGGICLTLVVLDRGGIVFKGSRCLLDGLLSLHPLLLTFHFLVLLLQVGLRSAVEIESLLDDREVNEALFFLLGLVDKLRFQGRVLSVEDGCLRLHKVANISWFCSNGRHRGQPCRLELNRLLFGFLCLLVFR